MIESNAPLTPRVVAAYCHVSKNRVMKWIKDGKLQASRLPGGHYRIDREDFKGFLERHNMSLQK